MSGATRETATRARGRLGPPTRQPPMKGPAVTTKSDFSEEEWSRILRAPLVAGLAISLADPSGPIEAAKESMATVESFQSGATGDRGGPRYPGGGPAEAEPA